MKTVNGDFKIGLFLLFVGGIVSVNQAFAGQVTYVDDSYTAGDTLTASDLNAKFNEIKSAVNDNDGKSTLSDLSCASGQVAKWNGSAWACAADIDTNTDSAGVEFASSSSTFQLSTTTSTIQSVTVSAPGPGYIIVSYSSTYRMLHANGIIDQIEVGISDSSSATVSGLPSRRFLYMDSGFPSGNFYGSVATSAVFIVGSAGTYTYYVLGVSNKATATGDFYVAYPATQAVFVPNRY